MAVQAQHPSVGEHRNRPTQLSGQDFSAIDLRTLPTPIPYHGPLVDECQKKQQQLQQVFMGGPAVEGMQRLFQHGASPLPIPGLVLPNFALNQPPPLLPVAVDSIAVTVTGGARKRRKESVDRRSSHMQPQQSHLQLGVDLNQTLGCSPVAAPQPGANVSTGLRLAFDDERSTVTSSKPPNSTAAVALSLRDEISAQLSLHQEELNQILRAQAEQLRQSLEERTQRHSKVLVAAMEGGLFKRVREKEVELERVNRRNLELEETVRQLSMESQMWQSKAKNNEAMVAILRTNLQQAVVQHQSREHSKLEGCGDSEADDAASAYIDENLPAQHSRAMMNMIKAVHFNHSTNNNEPALVRACRRCRAKEASVVLLPCLHLCLCIGCKDAADRCPICSSLKSASAEVYLS